MMTRTPLEGTPPRWAERLLDVFLEPRDRETIAGDLLEEYREVVLPTRGRFRAQLWYVRQVLSLVHGVKLGAALGAAAGAWNLISTRLEPLADDTLLALLAFYGPMFAVYAVAGFSAYRRTGRLLRAVLTGATVAFVTFLIFFVAILLRVNMFLELISPRADRSYIVSS
jgi:hypothetical protein